MIGALGPLVKEVNQQGYLGTTQNSAESVNNSIKTDMLAKRCERLPQFNASALKFVLEETYWDDEHPLPPRGVVNLPMWHEALLLVEREIPVFVAKTTRLAYI